MNPWEKEDHKIYFPNTPGVNQKNYHRGTSTYQAWQQIPQTIWKYQAQLNLISVMKNQQSKDFHIDWLTEVWEDSENVIQVFLIATID